MKKFAPAIVKYLSPILFTLVLNSCGVWEDFTTYFNLYYNTKDKFVEAEKAIQQQRKNLFQFEDSNIPGNAAQLLNSVIEKSSKILQFHSSSSFVDDALLMLGKSFYYQKNYQKAIRKFQELIVTLPESDLILENELWIAKTQMRLKDYKNGLDKINSVRMQAVDEGADEIIQEAFVEEAVHYIVNEDYSKAIALINEFLEVSNNDEINAEVTYELGRLYLKINDIANAIVSFEKVFEYEPTFIVEFNSKIELATALRKTGENELALNILEDMRGENKYSDSFDKIDLETGVTMFDLGRVEESVSILTKADTAYKSSINSGVAKFKLGEIYEFYYKNFDSASIYYNKSATTINSPEYLKLASEKSQLFKKYQTLQKNIFDSQKQLSYLNDSELFVQDSIAYYSDTLDSKQDDLDAEEPFERARGEQSDKGLIPPVRTQNKVDIKNPPLRPSISADSVRGIIVKNEFDLANLFDNELEIPDSAYHYYKDIVDNYSDSRFYSRSLYSLGTYYGSVGRKAEADSILNYIYDNYKTESVVNAAALQLKRPLINLTFDPADELYTEAENKLLEKKYSESINGFYSIFQNYPKSPLAPKALLAGGWVLENELKLLDSAAAFYDSINVRYPQSQYASSIKPKLTFYKQEVDRKKKAVEDSLKQIEANRILEINADSLKKSVAQGIDSTKKMNDSMPVLKTNNTAIDSLGILENRKSVDSSDIKEPEKTDLQRKR
jgi:outer membrane protein assembly factor BamD (BamD/ComL family)